MRRSRRHSRGVSGRIALGAAAAAVALALSLPVGAAASKADYVNLHPIASGIAIVLKAGPGERNDVLVEIPPDHPNDYRIIDLAGIKDPLPPQCVRESPTAIRCPRRFTFATVPFELEVTEVNILLGDEADTFQVGESGGIPAEVMLKVEAGEGNDFVKGRPAGGREELYGADGDDEIITGPPEEGKVLDGGGGNDRITVIGAAPRTAAPAKGSTMARLLGGAGRDLLTGGPGPDSLAGGTGRDRLRGGGGDDRLRCGGGKDSAVGGGGSDRSKDCESVKGVEST